MLLVAQPISQATDTASLPQVYKVAKQWEGLPSCDEIAAVMRREKRLREKRRVRQQAAAAGAPVPPPQPQQQEQLALPAPDAAAAAAGGEESDDEPIEVTAELSIDQVCMHAQHLNCIQLCACVLVCLCPSVSVFLQYVLPLSCFGPPPPPLTLCCASADPGGVQDCDC